MSTHTVLTIKGRPHVSIGAPACTLDLEAAFEEARARLLPLHIDVCGGTLEQFTSALTYLSALSLANGLDPIWRIHHVPLAAALLATSVPADPRG